MKLLYLILFPFLLFSQSYPYFSNMELNKIKKHFGNIAKNRIIDYQKKISTLKKYTKKKQLNAVNIYLNQLLSQYDAVANKQENYWSTPKEFLITGYGDCEDYAIIKYFTLINLGFDEKKLFITTAFEQYSGGYHMVLSYFRYKHKPPLILDNLSFRILDLKTRTDIKADMFINKYGVFKIDKKYNLHKVAKNATQYIDLMDKIKKNH